MDALLVSTGLVAIAEIGDKTQLLALMLAARFRRPVPVILGILFATLANHALAALAGTAVSAWLGPDVLRWLLGVSFLAMAAWAVIPDRMDATPRSTRALGPFLTTLIAFFVVEIGDKTQIATVALAARYEDWLLVACGTTLGMLLANVPVVLLGGALAAKLPMRLVRLVAATLFAALGVLALAGAGFS